MRRAFREHRILDRAPCRHGDRRPDRFAYLRWLAGYIWLPELLLAAAGRGRFRRDAQLLALLSIAGLVVGIP